MKNTGKMEMEWKRNKTMFSGLSQELVLLMGKVLSTSWVGHLDPWGGRDVEAEVGYDKSRSTQTGSYCSTSWEEPLSSQGRGPGQWQEVLWVCRSLCSLCQARQCFCLFFFFSPASFSVLSPVFFVFCFFFLPLSLPHPHPAELVCLLPSESDSFSTPSPDSWEVLLGNAPACPVHWS